VRAATNILSLEVITHPQPEEAEKIVPIGHATAGRKRGY
jgi:hypothetical protein